MLFHIPVIFKIFAVIFNLSSCLSQKSYNGFALYRITPTTQYQLQYILNLTRQPESGLDFWLQTSAVNNSADVMVSPSVADRTIRNLNKIRITYKLLIPDIGKVIEDDLTAEVNVPFRFQFYSDYPSINEISLYMGDIADLYPDHVSVLEIGTSFEGRSLEVLRISVETGTIKPAIWIQGGAHAREQIGAAAVLFIAMKLSSMYDVNDEIFDLIKSFDWYLLPVLNPDGYNYCQLEDRLWRKTRSQYPNSKQCIGVDANRNWDIKWNNTGSSPNPCSHTYAGPYAFSEPETKAVSEFMRDNLRNRLELFVDFHSYSQRWLTPWGYTSKLPPTYKEQKRLAEIGTLALQAMNGTTYSVGSSGNIMYTVSGGARDWASDIMGAKYSYVVELRDKGQFGFLLPRRQILPTVKEAWEGIRAMSLELYRLAHPTFDLA